jgi:hypothetical protein
MFEVEEIAYIKTRSPGREHQAIQELPEDTNPMSLRGVYSSK